MYSYSCFYIGLEKWARQMSASMRPNVPALSLAAWRTEARLCCSEGLKSTRQARKSGVVEEFPAQVVVVAEVITARARRRTRRPCSPARCRSRHRIRRSARWAAARLAARPADSVR